MLQKATHTEIIDCYYNITVSDDHTGRFKTYRLLRGPLDEAISDAKRLHTGPCEFYNAYEVPITATMEAY